MSVELRAVALRSRGRHEAHEAYIAAVLGARAAGYTLSEIGRAAGVSRHAVWQVLRLRTQTKEEA